LRRFEIIGKWISPGSKVLVLGCGSGDFLDFIIGNKKVKACGIDIDSEKVYKAISGGLSVTQGDINTDLYDYPDKTFDYVIAHDIIQIMKKPDEVIKQITRIGSKAVISFPNFAYFMIRLTILLSGRMPKTKILPYEWYDTPNIHLFTIKDFRDFCRKKNLHIIEQYFTGIGKNIIPPVMLPNFFAEFAYFLIDDPRYNSINN
jgi:methionine biosynthesis protein MetW